MIKSNLGQAIADTLLTVKSSPHRNSLFSLPKILFDQLPQFDRILFVDCPMH
jgi:hypothetical protein